MQSPSTISLDRCDVRDKEKLAVYRYFREQWVEMLDGENEHAISKQISILLGNDLQFHTINHARKLCEEAQLPKNDMVHSFINKGFFAHQALIIRRITEDYDGQRRKAVYSLPRIISEIEAHGELITREMYVCFDGVPYIVSDGPANESNLRHNDYDELSKVDPTARTRDDQIHPECFSQLRSRLKSSDRFRTYANKRLAHAADPATRKGNETFSLKDLEDAYKDLAWLTNELSGKILCHSGHTFLPSFVYDVLEHIENPICPESQREKLDAFWDQRNSELKELECNA